MKDTRDLSIYGDEKQTKAIGGIVYTLTETKYRCPLFFLF